MVAKEFLDSDRVNFLVWRYLLEGNYRETAAKFQKEWNVKQPHREFAFAPYVKSHALVSVINRGLLYYSLERDYARNKLPQDANVEAVEALQIGIFGSLNTNTSAAKIEEEDEDAEGEEIIEPTRKRAPQQSPDDSPTKRQRLSNGFEDGAEVSAPVSMLAPAPAPVLSPAPTATETAPATATITTTTTAPPTVSEASPPTTTVSTSTAVAPAPMPTPTPAPAPASMTMTTPMDVDTQPDNNAYPSPLEGEQVPESVVRTDGPEQGTQVDKVEELAPETTFIRLAEPEITHGHSHHQNDGRNATTPTPPSPSGSDNAPILLQCEWNPRDPSVLAAAGTDALARVWTVTHARRSEAEHDHVSPQSHSLLDRETPRDTTVTALSWSSDGNVIAVATDQRNKAAINVWAADGTHLQSMEVSEPPIIKLSWNPSNTALLAISPDKGGARVTAYDASTGSSISYALPGHDIAATPLDAVWTGDVEFLLCGGDLMICLQCTEREIVQTKKLETSPDDSFTQVLFDGRSNLAATSSDKGTLDLWDEAGQRRTISAHQGAITTMQWQPLPANQVTSEDERLIATGGDDCAILVWNARLPESKPKCFLTMDSPIMRLAFTPDGAFIAGATATQVLIWKVGSHAMPRASWNRPTHTGWLSPKATAESDEEDEHCLCWDAEGRKLAYGSNSRLAIINFSRP